MPDQTEVHWWMPTDSHREAAARCLHLLERQSGCGLLCGASGSGKSTVLRRLARRAARRTHRTGLIDLNGLNAAEFTWRLCATLRLSPSNHGGPAQRWSQLTDALSGAASGHVATAIFFDHADFATLEALGELRRWLQLADDQRQTVTIIAARTPLGAPLQALLSDFCDLRAEIPQFSVAETAAFLKGWEGAEAGSPLLATADAVAAHELTHGEPRKLARLCRLATLAAAAENEVTLDRAALESLVRELTSFRPAGSPGVIPGS